MIVGRILIREDTLVLISNSVCHGHGRSDAINLNVCLCTGIIVRVVVQSITTSVSSSHLADPYR